MKKILEGLGIGIASVVWIIISLAFYGVSFIIAIWLGSLLINWIF
jgi:hypothetical protein